ncbi:CurL C-terminal domain-containing protein [Nostoc sp.]
MNLADVAYTRQRGRKAFNYQRCVILNSGNYLAKWNNFTPQGG